jgi:hypothetical protein
VRLQCSLSQQELNGTTVPSGAMSADDDPHIHRKAACATYVEQTKLLVTLASAFLVAPVGFIAFLKDRSAAGLANLPIRVFLVTEALLIASVLFGYVVLGSLAGSQNDGTYDIYRPATRIASLIQFGCYVVALLLFVVGVTRALA